MWWWTAEMLEITIIKNPEPVHVSPSWNEKCTALPLGSRGVAACSVHYIAPTTSEISFSWRTQREEVKDGLLWTQSARKIVHVWVAMFQRIIPSENISFGGKLRRVVICRMVKWGNVTKTSFRHLVVTWPTLTEANIGFSNGWCLQYSQISQCSQSIFWFNIEIPL